MRKTFISLLLTCFVCSAVEVDVVIHWDGLPRNLVTNYSDMNPGLSGATSGWYPYGGGAAGNSYYIEARTNTMTFPTSVILSNQTVTGNGSNWMRSDWSVDGAAYLTLGLPGGYEAPAQTNVAIAGFVALDLDRDPNFGSTDMIWMLDTGGHSGVMNTWGGYLRAHAIRNNGTSSYSDQAPFYEILVTQNKTYYFTLVTRYNTTNTVLNLYDTDSAYTHLGICHAEIGSGNVYAITFPAGYIAQPGRSVYWGPMFVIYNPSAAEIDALVPTQPTFLTLSNMVAAASPGDTITFPRGVADWTNTLVLNKSNLIVNGDSAWLTNWFANGPAYADPLIQVSASGITISNLNISGAYTQYGGGIAIYAFNARLANCGFTKLNVPVWTWALSNVTENCWFSETYMVEKVRGVTDTGDILWTNYYPLPWNTLNASFIEDCWITNSVYLTGTPLFFEGQRGAYVARRNHFYLSALNKGYQTADAHGDDNDQRGTLLSILSENDFHFSNGAYSLATAYDLRGGMSLTVSNTYLGTTAPYVRLQEECDYPGYNFVDGKDWVTNSFMWGNTGMAGAFVRYDPPYDSSTNYLTIGAEGASSFTLAAPTNFVGLATYPHPLRGSLPAAPGLKSFRGRAQINGTGKLYW